MRSGILVIALVACTEPSRPPPDPTPTPTIETGTDTGTPTTPSLDYTVRPAPGTIDEGPLVEVVFTYEVPLDPGSGAASIEDDAGRMVPHTIAVQGSTVSLDPDLALPLGQTFTVEVTGLLTADGTALPAASTSFTVHPELQVAETETPSTLTRWTFDDQGRRTRRIVFNDEGDDGVFGTPDDGLSFYDDHAYDAQGRESGRVRYRSPGKDGTWLNGDDPPDQRWVWTYEGDVATEAYITAGPDMTLDTADDVTQSWFRIEDRPGERRTLSSRGAGSDGVLFTGDDLVLSYRKLELTPAGEVSRDVTYASPGPDLEPFTSDDVISFVEETAYDPEGRRIELVVYVGPGDDAAWDTDDDDIDVYVVDERDLDGRLTRSTTFFGPGPNLMWFDDDDAIAFHDVPTRDADGVRERLVSYGQPGDDGAWFTGDDVVDEYMDYTVVDGFVRERIDVRSAGGDGTWFTADDPVAYREAYQTPLAPSVP